MDRSLPDPPCFENRLGRDYTPFEKFRPGQAITCIAPRPQKNRFLPPVAEVGLTKETGRTDCHSERIEKSIWTSLNTESHWILRCAQNDMKG
jgi:hypothetical protein